MRRGEVWWYEPPEDKRRPVLILIRNEAIEPLNDLVVAPATRTIRSIPTAVELGRDDGLPQDCALSLDNTFLAEKAFLTERITSLGADKLAEVCHALRLATDC